jgi:hypothetical protein
MAEWPSVQAGTNCISCWPRAKTSCESPLSAAVCIACHANGSRAGRRHQLPKLRSPLAVGGSTAIAPANKTKEQAERSSSIRNRYRPEASESAAASLAVRQSLARVPRERTLPVGLLAASCARVDCACQVCEAAQLWAVCCDRGANEVNSGSRGVWSAPHAGRRVGRASR